MHIHGSPFRHRFFRPVVTHRQPSSRPNNPNPPILPVMAHLQPTGAPPALLAPHATPNRSGGGVPPPLTDGAAETAEAAGEKEPGMDEKTKRVRAPKQVHGRAGFPWTLFSGAPCHVNGLRRCRHSCSRSLQSVEQQGMCRMCRCTQGCL